MDSRPYIKLAKEYTSAYIGLLSLMYTS